MIGWHYIIIAVGILGILSVVVYFLMYPKIELKKQISLLKRRKKMIQKEKGVIWKNFLFFNDFKENDNTKEKQRLKARLIDAFDRKIFELQKAQSKKTKTECKKTKQFNEEESKRLDKELERLNKEARRVVTDIEHELNNERFFTEIFPDFSQDKK